MFGYSFDTIIVAAMGSGWPRAGSSGLGLSPNQGHFIVFLGKTLYSHGASLRPGVQMGGSNLMLGVTCDGLASNPEGRKIPPITPAR